MNEFFRRLPLPVKLLLISLIPLAFLIFLFIQLYLEKTQKVDLLNTYLNRIHQSADMAMLIDGLQEERRYSYEYALKKDKGPEMREERPQTDSVITRLKNYGDPSIKNFTDYTFLNELESVRNRLDSFIIAPNQVMHYYSNMIFRLNTLNNVTAGSNIYLQHVYPDLVAQKLMSEMVTYLGILGANVYNVLYNKQYMIETLVGSYGVHQVYHTYEKELYTKAPPQLAGAYKNLLNGSLGQTVTYLDTLFKNFRFDDTYTYSQWSQVYTSGLQQLRQLQQQTLRRVEKETEAMYAKEQQKKNLSILLLLLSIAIAMAIVAYTVIVVNQMLNELKHAAQKIARGNSNIHLQKFSNDAIGSLAESIIQIDRSNKALAQVAEAIGKGNFGVPVVPRSQDDILSHAILKMKDRLQHFTSELKEQEGQLRELADFMPQIVWTANKDGKVDYWNKQWYEFSGLSKEDSNEAWTEIMHPDDLAHTLAVWNNAVTSGQDYQIEYRLQDARTKEYKWFIAKAVAIRDENQNIIKWFGTCTEIHERKTISEQLEAMVVQRTEELKRSNEDLQQFAHVASHDLKEPLRKVQTFGSRLLIEFGDHLPDRGREFVHKMNHASERMSRMVDGILNYSTINSAEHPTEAVNLNDLITGIQHDLEMAIQQKEALIEHDVLPIVSGNAVLLHQLFYNLLNNALKFSQTGRAPHITLSCTKEESSQLPQDAATGALQAHYYHLSIKDNGIGFNTAFSEKIFELFSRLNNSSQFEGTGLGLALCKKIVRRHNGFIYANGKENEGATFHIYLPAQAKESPGAKGI